MAEELSGMAADPGVMVSMTLACDERAPSAVRVALAEVSGDSPAFGDAMLVASELVTNAVRHSGGAPHDNLEVEISRRDHDLIISVRDPGASDTSARASGPTSEAFNGLGLLVVQQLASQWGEERGDGDGYCVWARLSLG